MRIKFYSLATIFSLLFLFMTSNTSAETNELRISGKNRFDTAVQISQTGFDKSETVILSTAYNFPDALAGGPLAYKYDAPILLTSKDTLGEATKSEILRLKAKKAIILGSKGVVSQKVEEELKYIGVTVERVGGVNRFETAKLIANKLDATDTAIITYGYNFPDALAIAPYAAKNGYPILLVQKDSIPAATKEYLKNIKKTFIIGGTGIISADVESQLPDPTRISGKDRFQTNAKIIQNLQMDTFNAYVSTGYNFADALTGSVLAAKENAALLLVNPTALPQPIHYVLNEKKFSETIPLGGKAVVSDQVIQQMTDLAVNDTAEKAIPIKEGTYTSHLISSNDKDYYKIKMEQPGQLTFSMDRRSEDDWYLKLYNKEGNEISYSEIKTGIGTYSIQYGLPSGEFFIKLTDLTGYGHHYDENERYTFTIKIDNQSSYEQELNNTIASATAIELNTKAEGAIQRNSSGTDVDYYSFNVQQPGKVEFKFQEAAESDWNVYVYGENGDLLGSDTVYSGAGTVNLSFGLAVGKYYIKVTDETGYGKYYDYDEYYSFQVNFTESDRYEQEFNETFETATPVKLDGNANYGIIQGKPYTTDDVDFYTFNVTTPGMVSFKMPKGESDDWNVKVYDSNGVELGYTVVRPGTDSTLLYFGLQEGTYYIKITDYIDGIPYNKEFFEEYSFTLAIETGNQFEKEYNDKHNYSTLLAFGTTYTGVIQGRELYRDEDVDYYKFTLSQDDVITFEMKEEEYSDWEYTIYDENLNAVGSGEVKTGLSTYKKDFNLREGIYYIKIQDATDIFPHYYRDKFEKYSFKITN
ncbi:cell wall-binding repeat-containing protein [Mesobacillus subterraneus]|uniref:cell wall-binding repeat-containing protein n=1 Tax=Mesobacillus subterraneus TaxID=285983 RepID=UPI001CFC659F|nr:cell wall-binding repeat-containing protein [Mesobacillus subterraneus]